MLHYLTARPVSDKTVLHYLHCSVTDLLNKGADVNIRCRWTNMTALLYAAYFDVVPLLKVLLKTSKDLGK